MKQVLCINSEFFRCDECEYENDTRVQIMYHMRTDHETSFGENKCDECEYKNDTRVQIMNHMRTVHETSFVYQLRIYEKNVPCDECGYKNDTRVQIMYHMRTDHETSFGENECDECGYEVKLKTH